MSVWIKQKLGNIGKVITGKTPPTSNQEYFGTDYPFITPSDIPNYKVRNTTNIERYLSEKWRNKAKNYLLPPKTVCYVCIGSTVGKSCMTEKESFSNQQINSVVCDEEKAQPDYLFYYLRNKTIEIKKIADASGAGKGIINKTSFENLDLTIPDLPTQTRVASVLSAYDDLIENNEKRIKILEEMAERLYREWFVKFKFPGHEKVRLIDSGAEYGKIPEGWGVSQVQDLYETSSGGTPSRKNENEAEFYYNASIPWIKTKELNDSYILDTEEKITELAVKKSSAKIFPKNTALIAMYGATIGKLGILSQPAATNQACCAFLLKEPVFSSYYIFQFLKDNTKKITSLAFGAAQPNISQNTIRNIGILKPAASILELYNRKVDVIFNEILLLQKNNQNLSKTRDLLIPQLVTGKRKLRN